jgi:regulator of cell morphogenesis and NO signaling
MAAIAVATPVAAIFASTPITDLAKKPSPDFLKGHYPMDTHAQTNAVEQIAHILVRFHETHRRELPEILRLAGELEASGAAPGLLDQLAAMAEALDSHMFKEEMRLFPMMEQGGNTLIGHLIDDMHEEHLAHRAEMARLESLLSKLPAAAEQLAPLRAALGKLFADLVEHIHAEDDVLFPMFISRPLV